MKNIVLLVVFVLGIVFMQFAQAQSVDEIINKYIDARGGKDKLNAVKSVYMEGARQMMGNEVEVKVTMVQGKLYRNDFQFGGSPGYTIVTPKDGWSLIPMRSPTPEPIAENRLKEMQGQLDIAGPLADYALKGNKVELQGKETIEGKEAYKLHITLNNGKEVTYFIDTKTNLLVQTRQMAAGMGGRGTGTQGQEKEVITNFSDYQAVDGILFPHTISNPGSGPMGGSTTFDKIELNKMIDENQYKPAK
ncbi:MAG: hypothetical protein ABJA57_05310 [Ginsengibacter sp.]